MLSAERGPLGSLFGKAFPNRQRDLIAGLDQGRNQDPSGTQLVPPTCLECVRCLLVSAFCRERPLGVSVRKSFSEQTERPHCRTGPGTEPRPKRDSVGPTNMFGVCEVPLGECFLQREAPWGVCSEKLFRTDRETSLQDWTRDGTKTQAGLSWSHQHVWSV